MKKWLTLANVDGTGRQLIVIYDGTEVWVRAGCFFGTADEMVTEAKKEDKLMYVAIITAVAGALKNEAS